VDNTEQCAVVEEDDTVDNVVTSTVSPVC